VIESPNRDLLLRVANRLEPLLDELVFVGGQVTELHITDPIAEHVRPTDDVDVICEVASRSEYYYLGQRLKKLGFTEDVTEGAPICRWRAGEDVVDVMPTDEEILRFKSAWYPLVLATAQPYELTRTLTIRIASPPAFVATKWEAFQDRGEGTWYGSSDVEDIVKVVAGREELLEELRRADGELRGYVVRSTASMFEADVVEDVIAAALPESNTVSGLLARVAGRFENIARLDR
jgi:predicted nucleotidyltransferase